MLTLLVLVVALPMILLLQRYLRSRPDSRALWRSSIRIGLSIGIARAIIASIGFYTVEHTGGPLQIPAYAMAMLALPEGVILGRQRGPASPQLYVSLSVLLIATSLLFVLSVAFVVHSLRKQSEV